MVMGIVLISYSNMVQENSTRYDVFCLNDAVCKVEIALEETLEAPVYLYYQLGSFY
jgi:hypothetical protein